MIDCKTKCARSALRLVLLASVLIGSPLAAQVGVSTGNGQTVGAGGQYRGPSDVIPPNLIPVDCTQFDTTRCDASSLPTSGPRPATCSALDNLWEPKQGQCVGCVGDTNPEACYRAEGHSIDFGAARQVCNNNLCNPGPSRQVTTCKTVDNVCTVIGDQGAWIDTSGFAGKPSCAALPVQLWINGEPQLDVPRSLDLEAFEGIPCGSAEVCMTFNLDCFCDLASQWEQSLAPDPGAYDFVSWLHIGAIKCEECNCG